MENSRSTKQFKQVKREGDKRVGTSDDAEQFAWLRRYSPLHNLERGRAYPPTLVMTGDHDDRVLPGHSYKFASALQAAQGWVAQAPLGGRPSLLQP